MRDKVSFLDNSYELFERAAKGGAYKLNLYLWFSYKAALEKKGLSIALEPGFDKNRKIWCTVSWENPDQGVWARELYEIAQANQITPNESNN